jgi:hypothetical protein
MPPRPRHSPFRLAVICLALAAPLLALACADRPAPPAPAPRYVHPLLVLPDGAPLPPRGEEPTLDAEETTNAR